MAELLPRVEPAYPIEAARDGKEGCATLEYVITPDYQITDVRIVETTARYFRPGGAEILTKVAVAKYAGRAY
ncbi:energy transducer TonB [Alishewanella longhuensis]